MADGQHSTREKKDTIENRVGADLPGATAADAARGPVPGVDFGRRWLAGGRESLLVVEPTRGGGRAIAIGRGGSGERGRGSRTG